MEFSGKLHNFYGPVSDLKAVGKKSLEWDLNDWKWDADLLVATPLSSVSSDFKSRQFFPGGSDFHLKTGVSNSVSSGSDGMLLETERGNSDLEKRRRVVEIENAHVGGESGSLNLKLGGQVNPFIEGEVDKWEGRNGKKFKASGAPSNRAVCQVEDCKADLSGGKDYHRRHKVCDVHSKATEALVGDVMQRFCQQCSRFHVLEEFDEGKRSCRRRLAGHNKRRRKKHPVNAVNDVSLNDRRGSDYLLTSLLRILSNVHSNNSGETKDTGLLSHLLRNFANLGGTGEMNPARLLPLSQELRSVGTSSEIVDKEPTEHPKPVVAIPTSDFVEQRMVIDNAQCGIIHKSPASDNSSLSLIKANYFIKENASETTIKKKKVIDIDLNNVYDDSQAWSEDFQCNVVSESLQNLSPAGPLWLCKDSLQSSPPDNSGNSGSTSNQSPSTSSSEEQSRTDRIVFKLFGKDPSDFPHLLRKQILDWLSNSPTDIESHIRPGCIILAIYLQMDNSMWEELRYNLASSLMRLLYSSNDSFWKTGWMYIQVQDHAAIVNSGQVVLDAPAPTHLPLKYHQSFQILSIKPIAVSISEDVQFSVKGINLVRPGARLLCSLDGKYLVHKNCDDMNGESVSFTKHDEIQSLGFSCAIPNIVGRGFIEVEDDCLRSSFYPFIVAEKDVCNEICSLESTIEVPNGESEKLKARDNALDFMHEMGWLLRRSCLKLRLGETSTIVDLFPFKRFRWLIEFSIDHDWCAVVKKLLSVLFSGAVDSGHHASVLPALLDIGLLHQAIRRNCRPMVEFLLEYNPGESLCKTEPNQKQYLFKPDDIGPGGLTPLHLAACLDGRENILDALTNDPQSTGIDAWKNVQDSAGLTPHDYASLRGHYSYNHLVQRKVNKKSKTEHTVVDIPEAGTINLKQKTEISNKVSKLGIAFEINHKVERVIRCSECERSLGWRTSSLSKSSSLRIYRPAMLSMVAIAAVCVCAALLFKSSPEVLYSFRPFRWELLKYGSE